MECSLNLSTLDLSIDNLRIQHPSSLVCLKGLVGSLVYLQSFLGSLMWFQCLVVNLFSLQGLVMALEHSSFQPSTP